MRNVPIWQTLMESALWWTSALASMGLSKRDAIKSCGSKSNWCMVGHVNKMFQPSYDLSKIATKRSFVKNPV